MQQTEDPRDCEIVTLKTGFRSIQVTFMTGFIAFPVLSETPLSRPCQEIFNALAKHFRFTSDNTVSTMLFKRFQGDKI
jgi:hypothetical protein